MPGSPVTHRKSPRPPAADSKPVIQLRELFLAAHGVTFDGGNR